VFLLKLDVLAKDLEDIKNQVICDNENGSKTIEDLEKLLAAKDLEIISLKNEIETKDNIILDIKATNDTNFEVIKNYSKNETKLKEEMSQLENRLEVKSKLLDEKSIELAAEIKKHQSCLGILDKRNTEIKTLKSVLKDATSFVDNKITQGIKAKCKVCTDDILKKAKEKEKKHPEAEEKREEVVKELKEGKASVVGVKLPVETVLECRRLFHVEKVRKFEIEKILNLGRSVVIRICNDESYTDPMYYPGGVKPYTVVTTPVTDAVTDVPTTTETFRKPKADRKKNKKGK
jgi:chromosome segregation ATPase